jgi:hypothetical protein
MGALSGKIKATAAAAAAVAATAALMPASVATADPDITAANASAVGNSALAYLDSSTNAFVPDISLRSIFENDLWWFGPANPDYDGQTLIQIDTANFLPPIIRDFYATWLDDVDFTACFGGFATQFGPYGSVRLAYGSHC